MGSLTRRMCIGWLLASALVSGCGRAYHRESYADCATYVRVRHLPDGPDATPAGQPPAATLDAPPQTPTRLPDFVPPPAPATAQTGSLVSNPTPQACSVPAPIPSSGEEQQQVPSPVPPPQPVPIRGADTSARPAPPVPPACRDVVAKEVCCRPTVLPPVEIVVPPPKTVCCPQPAASSPCHAALRGDLTIQSSVVGEEPASPRTTAGAPPMTGPYGHGQDYGWLKGEVEKSLHGVRLRYARVDEEDTYGGSVTLVADAQVDGLRDGQRVRVRGHLVDPQASNLAPAYKVIAVEALGR